MGKGRSSQGGGLRDNRRWASAAGGPAGYKMAQTAEEADKQMGLGNGGETDEWGESLSGDEYAAVRWYIDASSSINKLERYGIVQDAPREFLAKTSADLDQALSRGENPRMIVTRITGPELFDGETSVQGFRKLYGKEFTDKGFTSTEVNQSRPLEGKYGTGQGQIYMHVKVPKGKGIGQYIRGQSGAETEQEFLFNRGSTFKVLGAYEVDGMTHVNVRYVGRSVRGKR